MKGTLLVVCQCGHELGRFGPFDDHNGVNMVCPKCGTLVHIPNGLLCEVLDNPEPYEPADRITANAITIT